MAPTHARSIRSALLAASALSLFPAFASAAPGNAPGYTVSVTPLTTGINLGYETAIDPVNRVLYATDAQPTTATKTPVYAADGTTINGYYTQVTQASSGKVVSLSSNTGGFLKNWSFLGLKGSDNIVGGGYTFGNPNSSTGIATGTNRGTANNPYGIAVDYNATNYPGTTPDPTIVTVQTRTSSVAIYKASQNAPTDADVTSAAAGGMSRARTPVVDSTRHLAYVASYGNNKVVVFNTQTKQLVATIPVSAPDALALDEANNLLYAGTFSSPDGNVVYVLDLSKLDQSAPLDATKNTAVKVATISGVGGDSRPGFDAVGKQVFTANSTTGDLSVIDVDPSHAAYRTVTKTITATGKPNSIAVDAQRRLVYSADLSSRILSVIDADTGEYIATVPTTGNALDVDVDPTSGVAYVSSMTTGNLSGAGQIQAVKVTRNADLPKGEQGAAGAAGPAGATGATGPQGLAGTSATLSNLSLSLTSLKLVGSKVSFTAPAAGLLTVKVTSGGRTIATGKRTAAKAGNYSLTLDKTAYGKALLKKRGTVGGTLTAEFSTAGTKAKSTAKRAVRTSLKR